MAMSVPVITTGIISTEFFKDNLSFMQRNDQLWQRQGCIKIAQFEGFLDFYICVSW